MPKCKELIVLLEGRRIGVLREELSGHHTFTYDASAADDLRLSLSMPRRAEPWQGKPVEAFIDGVLPDDRDMRRRIAGQYDGVNANNPFSLLTAIGLDCAGGVQFVPLENGGSLSLDENLKPIGEKEIGARLRSIAASDGTSWLQRDEHWSLNGSQTKIALRFQNGNWYEAIGAAPTTHIIKPGIPELHEQAFNEYVCMKTIAELQVPVAESRFQCFGDMPAIVSTRWDRRLVHAKDGTEKVIRIHQEDFCQATAHMTDEKYQSDGGPSAVDIVRCMRGNSLQERDVVMFVIALALNFLMAGTDAHAKNYAILEPVGEAPRLAPLYDVASGFAYETQHKQRKLAMSIGREYNYDNISLHDWQRFARGADIDEDRVEIVLRHYAGMLPDAFGAASAAALDDAAQLDRSADDVRRQLVQRIREGVDAQCSRVLRWFD